jgi:hypothetical protein
MMKVLVSAIGLLCVASLLLATTGAQETAVARRASLSERVRGLLAEAGVEVGPAVNTSVLPARAHRELRVSWEADKAALPRAAAAQYRNAPGRVTLSRAVMRREGVLPKQRSAELSPTQVVVVALDAEGRMRWCGLVADPRLLRAEAPGEDGALTGQVLYKESAEFVIQYPDDEAVAEVRLYHPDWDGQKFSLALVGAVAAR